MKCLGLLEYIDKVNIQFKYKSKILEIHKNIIKTLQIIWGMQGLDLFFKLELIEQPLSKKKYFE